MHIQINRAPSFATDEQLDYDVKSALLEDAFRLLNIRFGMSKNAKCYLA